MTATIEAYDPELFEVIDTEEMMEIISEIVIRKNKPVMFHGRAGYGKSQVGEQACEKAGAMMVDIRLSQYETVDLRGSLGVGREGVTLGHTVWYPPSTMPFIGNDAFPDDIPIVVFLDELTSATIPVLAVAYQLINERRIGEHILKPNVRIMAAGNLSDDKGIVTRIPSPLNNRMTHYKLMVSVEAFTKYANSVGIPPIFIAFWWFKKDFISTFNPKKVETVFASPRTWFTAVDYYRDDQLSETLKLKSMGGVIGKGVNHEFWAFERISKTVIPIKAIIADPEGVPLPEEESLCWATAMNVCGAMSTKNIGQLQKFIVRLGVAFQTMIWTIGPRRDPKLLTTIEFIQFSKLHREVFSGLVG